MAKTSEKAVAAVRPDNGPDFFVRARQEKNSRYFTTIGSAWSKKDRNENDLISIKLNSIPLGWDGSCILVRPFAQDQDATME
jgi:uncharacterized protein (DUF736 family)